MVSRIPPPEDDGTNRQPRSAGILALALVFAVVIGLWFLTNRDSGVDDSVAVDDTVASAPAATPDAAPSDDSTSAPEATPDADTSEESVQPSSTPSAAPSPAPLPEAPSTDPDSGLPTVYLLDLPPEAAETVDLIDRGPPYPYDKDGSTFGNYEGILPDHERGYYQEFTVETPGSYDRGARRIVEGAEGELYWTDDHYESFSRVQL